MDIRRSFRALAFIFTMTAFFVMFLLPGSPALASPAPQNLGDLEGQIKAQELRYKKMQDQIKESNQKLKAANKKEQKVIKDITNLSAEISKTEQLRSIAVLKRNKIANKIEEILSEIDSTSGSIEEMKRLLRSRVVAMYKYGGITEFNLLLSASGVQDAMSTSYMLSKIAEQDKALIDDLFSKKATLDKAKAELVKQKTELETRVG